MIQKGRHLWGFFLGQLIYDAWCKSFIIALWFVISIASDSAGIFLCYRGTCLCFDLWERKMKTMYVFDTKSEKKIQSIIKFKWILLSGNTRQPSGQSIITPLKNTFQKLKYWKFWPVHIFWKSASCTPTKKLQLVSYATITAGGALQHWESAASGSSVWRNF